MIRNQKDVVKARPHYRLQKTTLGVASVLLSTTLYFGLTAHADTVMPANGQPVTTEQSTGDNPAGGSKVTLPSAGATGNGETTGGTASNAKDANSANGANGQSGVPASATSVTPSSVETGNDQVANTKTITRTININEPGKPVSTARQEVTYTRADANAFWTTDHDQFDAYNLPSVPGYVAYDADNGNAVENGQVSAVKTTPNISNLIVNVAYRKENGTVTLNLVTSDNNVVATQSLSGQIGETKPVTLKLPDGFTLDAGQGIPTQVTIKGNDTESVAVSPVTYMVQPNDPKTTSDIIPGTTSLHFPTGLTESDLNRTVTRTIKITNLDGTVTTKVQPAVHFNRTATVTAYNGHLEYGAWNKESEIIPAFELPDDADGTPIVDGSLAAWEVHPNTVSSTINVRYVNSDATQQVIFSLDGTADGEVDETSVDGVVGQTVAVNLKVPVAYELVPGETLPTEVKLSSEDPDQLIIKVQDMHVTVTADDPKTPDDIIPGTDDMYNYPEGITNDDLNHTAVRTITVVKPDGSTTTKAQTVTVKRSAVVDVPNGDVTYNDWSTGSWDTYQVPVVSGYMPSQAEVPSVTVTDKTQDVTVKITYSANAHSMKLNYVDGNSAMVKSYTFNGNTDSNVDVNAPIPTGWKLSAGQGNVPASIHFGADGAQDLTFKIEHITKRIPASEPLQPGVKSMTGADVTADDPSQQNELMDWGTIDPATGDVTMTPTGDLTYPTGQKAQPGTKDDLNETITRQIILTNVDGTTQTINQTANLHRDATLDEVTGKLIYGDWSTGSWDDWTAPVVAGYHTNTPLLMGCDINHGDPSERHHVNYYPNDHHMNISFVDAQGNIVGVPTEIKGKTGATVNVPESVKVPTGWTLDEGQTIPTSIDFVANGHGDIKIKIHHATKDVNHENSIPTGEKTPTGKLITGAHQADLNKTITRMINVKNPNGQTNTTSQVAKISRNATVDEVTGDVTYGDWLTDDEGWKAYDVPSIVGYTPTISHVDAVTVNGQTQNSNIDITYTANDQSINVVYKDGNKVVKSVPLTGKTGQTVDVSVEVPDGYHQDNQIPSTYTFTGKDNHDITVQLSHLTQNATDRKDVTRTIDVTDPSGHVLTKTQKVTLSRTGLTDQVTHQTTWQDWSTATWDAYDVPTIAGYTPSQSHVDKVTVNGDTRDVTVNVHYTANGQSINVVYKDGNKVVKSVPLTGKTGQTVDVSVEVPDGYHQDNQIPSTYTFTGNDNHDITVQLSHLTQKVTDHKDVTRTINVTDPNGRVMTKTQKVTLSRTGLTDQVTHQTTWQDWSTATWNAYDVPTIAGYTPSQSHVDEVTVNGDTQDATVNVHYTANVQSINVIYKDGNKVVKSVPLTGKTGQTVDVNVEVPDGYHLDSQIPSTYTFTGKDNHDITVQLSHLTQNATDRKDVTRTIDVTDPSGHVLTKTQKVTLSRTGLTDQVTHQTTWQDWSTASWNAYDVPTIAGYTPSQSHVDEVTVNGDTQDATVIVHYTANDQSINVVYKDGNKVVKSVPLTGKTGQTVDVSVEVPDGYYQDNQIPSTYTFTGKDNHDITVQLSHLTQNATDRKDVTRTIDVTDPSGHVLTKTQKVTLSRTGLTDQVTHQTTWQDWSTASWNAYDVPTIAGYTPSQSHVDEVTVNGDTKDATVIVHYTANDQSINVVYKDGNKVVKSVPLTGKTGQTVDVSVEVPDGYYQDNQIPSTYTFTGKDNHDITVQLSHLTQKVTDHKDVTRTINVTDPNGRVMTKTQKVTLSRTGLTDQVTHQTTWQDWSTASWNAYDVPTIAGYTPSQSHVDEVTVNGDTKDATVNITYTANDQSINVVYKDGNKVVKSVSLTGKTGQTVDVNVEVPDGYHQDNQIPSTYTFTGNDNHDITVQLSHLTQKATDHKDVTRTINVTDPSGHVLTKTQKVTLSRTGLTDQVTHQTTWQGWSTASWNAYDVPTIAGYTPSQSHVDEVTVNGDTQDATVNVHYTANDQSINVVYKDGNKVLKSIPLTGKTGQTVDVNVEVPDGYHQDNQIPSTYTFTGNDNHDITVQLSHLTQKATDHKDVTRTINVTDPSGHVLTKAQKVTLSRTGLTDQVTHQTTWQDWSTATWNAYDVPTIAGYTPSQSHVDEVTVNGDTQDATFNVHYTANDQSINVVYKDGNKVVKSVPLTGKTGQTVDVKVEVPDGYHLIDQPVTSYKLKAEDNQDIIVKVDKNKSQDNVSTEHSSTKPSVQPEENSGTSLVGEKPAVDTGKTAAQPTAKQLPQTGNEHSKVAGVVGLAMASLATTLGFAKGRKED